MELLGGITLKSGGFPFITLIINTEWNGQQDDHILFILKAKVVRSIDVVSERAAQLAGQRKVVSCFFA